MCCGCHNNDKVVLLTAQQRMSHSVGGLAPGLSKTRTSHCHYTGSLLLMITIAMLAVWVVNDINFRFFMHV